MHEYFGAPATFGVRSTTRYLISSTTSTTSSSLFCEPRLLGLDLIQVLTTFQVRPLARISIVVQVTTPWMIKLSFRRVRRITTCKQKVLARARIAHVDSMMCEQLAGQLAEATGDCR